MAHQSSFGVYSKDNKSTSRNGQKDWKNLPKSIVSLYSSDSCSSDREDEDASRTAEGSVSTREKERKFYCKNPYEGTDSYIRRRKERCYRKRSRSRSKSTSPLRCKSQRWNEKESKKPVNHQQEYVDSGGTRRILNSSFRLPPDIHNLPASAFGPIPERITESEKGEALVKDNIELNRESTSSESLNHIVLPSYYNRKKINPKKYAEQIRKRKLLWGKKVKNDDDGGSHEQQTSSFWQKASFSGDENGKTTAKFQRLMGIRSGRNDDASQVKKGQNDQNKKQKEIFESMESQYEAARIATHTQRGVGLGFRAFPFPTD